jgi:hypothetical protein
MLPLWQMWLLPQLPRLCNRLILPLLPRSLVPLPQLLVPLLLLLPLVAVVLLLPLLPV